MSVLHVRNLTKRYPSGSVAVNNISFDLGKGETLGILGANGAGKTTTISMLLGLLTPTTGTIAYFGKDFYTHRAEIMERVGFGTTYAQFPGTLTIEANLDIYGRLFGLSATERKKRIQELLEQLNMWHMRRRITGGLSAGEMTRIILAKAFLAQPSVVLLDEPTASLDVDIALTIRGFVKEQQASQGVSFIITSHNMNEMTALCDRIIVMTQGNIIANSTPEGLTKTVHNTKLMLIVGDYLPKAVALAQEQDIPYVVEEDTIEYEIDEQAVASFLIELTKREITYTQISIKQPTLEDYFLSLQERRRKRT